jgi:hypothetical protein
VTKELRERELPLTRLAPAAPSPRFAGARVSLRQIPVRVAPFIVNNRLETMDRRRRSLTATAGRFRMEQAGMLPIGFVSPNAPCVLAPHAEERRRAHEHASSPASLRCDASQSMRAHALAPPHPSRRACARSNSRNVFGVRAPQDEDEHRVVHSSRFQTAHLVPAAHVCARGLRLCFTHPESRGGRSAEKRSGARRSTRGACT